MCMNDLIIKGGYGEHGRSCFLLSFAPGRYCMLDCGILDTDPDPYPRVEPELLSKTEYLFLSHCHKDHCGAFRYMEEHGFRGTAVASRVTMELSGIRYGNVLYLEDLPGTAAGRRGPEPGRVRLEEHLSFAWGKSGHCPGGVWLELYTDAGTIFYSGDYQARPAAYRCDRIRGRRADLAVVDCAHPETEKNGDELRKDLEERIRIWMDEGRRVCLPVPKYGRGVELAVFLKKRFPKARIASDRGFEDLCRRLLSYGEWIQPEAKRILREFLKEKPAERRNGGEYEILFLSDTHLERPESREAADGLLAGGGRILVTGRVRKGGYAETLLAEGSAEKLPYPHHQSRGDLKEVMEENGFLTVLPFHNDRKEIFFRKAGTGSH